VTWFTVEKKTEVSTLSTKGLPVAAVYFLPIAMKPSQVDHIFATSAGSVGSPAASNRSAR